MTNDNKLDVSQDKGDFRVNRDSYADNGQRIDKFFITYISAYGWKYNHWHSFDEESQAEAFINTILQRGILDLNHWNHMGACYGTQAWVDHEEQDIIAMERRGWL